MAKFGIFIINYSAISMRSIKQPTLVQHIYTQFYPFYYYTTENKTNFQFVYNFLYFGKRFINPNQRLGNCEHVMMSYVCACTMHIIPTTQRNHNVNGLFWSCYGGGEEIVYKRKKLEK